MAQPVVHLHLARVNLDLKLSPCKVPLTSPQSCADIAPDWVLDRSQPLSSVMVPWVDPPLRHYYLLVTLLPTLKQPKRDQYLLTPRSSLGDFERGPMGRGPLSSSLLPL